MKPIPGSVLVTGANGFLGSHLTRRLVEDGSHVVALVQDMDPRSDFVRSGTHELTTVVNGSLADYETVERAINVHEVNVVFHLGAQTTVGAALRSPLPTFESNIRGTYNVLEAARRMKSLVRAVVVASSDKAYGEGESLPYTEDMAPLGRHPYDVSKSCADLLAQSYAHTYGLPVAIARCGNIFGGGDLNWSRIVPGTIRSALRGERPVLRSDGTFIRDYIFVDDVVNAYLGVAGAVLDRNAGGEAYNFGNESKVTAIEMMRAVLNSMGVDDLEPVVADTARAEIRDQWLSAEKARKELGWEAEFSMEEGLSRTVAWYRDFFKGGEKP